MFFIFLKRKRKEGKIKGKKRKEGKIAPEQSARRPEGVSNG
jgi:hypothetical protein